MNEQNPFKAGANQVAREETASSQDSVREVFIDGLEPASVGRGKLPVFQIIIIGIIILFTAYFVILNLHSRRMINEILSEEEIFQLDKIVELEEAAEKLSLIPYQPVSPRLIRTFGDSFTSLSYIDRELTDMYWDSQVSAFVFPPRLSMKKTEDCGRESCGWPIQDSAWQGFCSEEACLERFDNNLFFANLPLSLPPEVDRDKIISLDIGGIGNDFLIGLVLGKEFDEEIWVYRFDGQKFYPLINNQTEFIWRLDSDRRGGRLGFGGQINNFFIVYGGYFGQIIHFNKDEFKDISVFFPLRLTTRGYYPMIQRSHRAHAFYVCNSNLNNISLIKFWHDKEGEIIGSVDLQSIALRNISAQRLLCLPGEDESDLTLLLQTQAGWQKWSLIDSGFNYQIIRQVMSNNVNASKQEIAGMMAADIDIRSPREPSETYQLFFANNSGEFLPAITGRWFALPTSGEELYWRIIFKTGDSPFYSPWFNSFNVLNYEIKE